MVGYIRAQGWTQVAIAFTNEDYGNGFATLFAAAARLNNLSILAQQSIEFGTTDETSAKNAAFRLSTSGAKIILYFGYLNEFAALTKYAKELNMWDKGYVWIGTDGLSGLPVAYANNPFFDGVLYFFPRESSRDFASKSFEDFWVANRLTAGNPFANISSATPGALSYFGATCVDLLLLGLDQKLKSGGFTVGNLTSSNVT
jgi:hypothetical protein